MGMTMTQKILAAHAGLESVTAGQLINAKLDIVLGNDITTPVAVNEFRKAGFDKVFDKDRVAIVLDHFVPNKDIKAAEQSKQCREFACSHCVSHFYDVGKMGIEHALLPEQGVVTAGDCIIGADSHTCTYGALGAFSTGVGSTDMAAGMATGTAWFKVPSAIKFNLKNKLPSNCSGKDIILTIIGMIGVDGALYKSMEFTGDGVANLSMDDRLCICNMAIEAGAKNGIFPVDEVTKAYMNGRSERNPVVYEADADAEYEKVIDIDLSKIVPTVACPHLPENTHPASELSDIKIDQVVIGSCTNGRMEDMETAYKILNGKKVADGVRCIIIPGTMQILRECVEKGYYTAFIDAGAVVSTPTCGPCLGGYMGILAAGERCVATTNRNFVGRMGHTESEVYLASPATAAASALTGYITYPKEV
ncbi:MAG: 3-isopropylmalate dehydratase large subunit [Clostridia bacterium]|nr:3-isopropylmalate dehydratase large subunit [Clostridia bacterium]